MPPTYTEAELEAIERHRQKQFAAEKSIDAAGLSDAGFNELEARVRDRAQQSVPSKAARDSALAKRYANLSASLLTDEESASLRAVLTRTAQSYDHQLLEDAATRFGVKLIEPETTIP